jgi:hypothetical protein
MSKQKAIQNPFFILLLVAGTVFAVTACAYGVMAVQALRTAAADSSTSDQDYVSDSSDVNLNSHPLVQWLGEHGATLMLIELAVLAVLTFAAIGTDHWWEKGGNRGEA